MTLTQKILEATFCVFVFYLKKKKTEKTKTGVKM